MPYRFYHWLIAITWVADCFNASIGWIGLHTITSDRVTYRTESSAGGYSLVITYDKRVYQDLSFADAQERAKNKFLPLNPDKSDYLDQSEGLAIRSKAPQRDNPTYQE